MTTQEASADTVRRVIAIVADALDAKPEDVHAHSSLMDDLGAESIDFLDLLFRLESDFGIKIPEDDLWRGSFEGTDQAAIDAGIARLKARMPDFKWDRLPPTLRREHLPRLITVQTIVDYLETREL
jgi:acyl carrier protein